MITLCIIIALSALILFGVAICTIAGGITGIAIVADIVVAIFVIGLIVKLISGK